MFVDRHVAQALLVMTEAIRTRALRHALGYETIVRDLGAGVADWAYADRGDEPGHRSPSRVYDDLRAWSPTPGDWARVVIGITGTGKTMAAARVIADRGGRMVHAEDADRWGFGGGAMLSEWASAHALLIDDVGDEKTSPGIANVAALIGKRYSRRLPTILTTTLPPVATGAVSLATRYGDHVVSRLGPHAQVVAERTDRRSSATPVTLGIHRERRIAGLAYRVALVRSAALRGGEAEDVVREFATATGVDLDTDEFRAAVERERAHQVSMDQAASGLIDELAPRVAVPMPERDPVIEAWIDGLGGDA